MKKKHHLERMPVPALEAAATTVSMAAQLKAAGYTIALGGLIYYGCRFMTDALRNNLSVSDFASPASTLTLTDENVNQFALGLQAAAGQLPPDNPELQSSIAEVGRQARNFLERNSDLSESLREAVTQVSNAAGQATASQVSTFLGSENPAPTLVAFGPLLFKLILLTAFSTLVMQTGPALFEETKSMAREFSGAIGVSSKLEVAKNAVWQLFGPGRFQGQTVKSWARLSKRLSSLGEPSQRPRSRSTRRSISPSPAHGIGAFR